MNQLVFVESKSMRDAAVSSEWVLDKVKMVSMLPDGQHVTTEMAANYYEVGLETVKGLIKDHKIELDSDGLKTLKGDELRYFKSLCQIETRAKHLTLIPRRALLRIGMLLRDSEVAKAVRTYLLNVEEKAPAVIRQEADEEMLTKTYLEALKALVKAEAEKETFLLKNQFSNRRF